MQYAITIPTETTCLDEIKEPGVHEWWDGIIEAVHEAARVTTGQSWCVDSAYENGDYQVLVEV